MESILALKPVIALGYLSKSLRSGQGQGIIENRIMFPIIKNIKNITYAKISLRW
jgi:hypothetical protein